MEYSRTVLKIYFNIIILQSDKSMLKFSFANCMDTPSYARIFVCLTGYVIPVKTIRIHVLMLNLCTITFNIKMWIFMIPVCVRGLNKRILPYPVTFFTHVG